jgi:mercuric ion transport protein
MQVTWRTSLIAGGLAAIGASLCCLAPLVLITLGIGGAWVSSLTAMEPYRPYFVGGAFLFLAMAYRKLYHAPQVCGPDNRCTDPSVRNRQKGIFWFVTTLLLSLVAVPWLIPLI